MSNIKKRKKKEAFKSFAQSISALEELLNKAYALGKLNLVMESAKLKEDISVLCDTIGILNELWSFNCKTSNILIKNQEALTKTTDAAKKDELEKGSEAASGSA